MVSLKIITKGISVKNPIIIEGFPGVGLVGSIASKYLVQHLKAKQVGHIEAEHMPPVSFIIDGEIHNPIRIYESKRYNLLIIESEFPVPAPLVHDIGEHIAVWAKSIKASKIICLEGLTNPNLKTIPAVFAISTGIKLKLPAYITPIRNGIMLGVSSALMLKCKELGLPGMCLMAESHSNFPDGIAAAEILKDLGKYLRISIDTALLEKEAHTFQDKIREVIDKSSAIARDSKDGRIIYG